jgi:hypothetical protein
MLIDGADGLRRRRALAWQFVVWRREDFYLYCYFYSWCTTKNDSTVYCTRCSSSSSCSDEEARQVMYNVSHKP